MDLTHPHPALPSLSATEREGEGTEGVRRGPTLAVSFTPFKNLFPKDRGPPRLPALEVRFQLGEKSPKNRKCGIDGHLVLGYNYQENGSQREKQTTALCLEIRSNADIHRQDNRPLPTS